MRQFARDSDVIAHTSPMEVVKLGRTMCCGRCGRRMNNVVLADSGRTEIRCGACDVETEATVVPINGSDFTP